MLELGADGGGVGRLFAGGGANGYAPGIPTGGIGGIGGIPGIPGVLYGLKYPNPPGALCRDIAGDGGGRRVDCLDCGE